MLIYTGLEVSSGGENKTYKCLSRYFLSPLGLGESQMTLQFQRQKHLG